MTRDEIKAAVVAGQTVHWAIPATLSTRTDSVST